MPLFEITSQISYYVAAIAELIWKLNSTSFLFTNPTLRRANRIRSIHGSLAVDRNKLSLEQVTDALNGKPVLASAKDIAEVKNAFEIYERLGELDPYSIDDLLTAHSIMTQGTKEESKIFRNRPERVIDCEGKTVHSGPQPQYVSDLVTELLDWVKYSEVHMLIRSCVFHYELERIHPFADGNGRIVRLWHTLLLSKWNPAFAWLPVESIIYDRQQEYQAAIKTSKGVRESTRFIEFMLSAIKDILQETVNMEDEVRDKKEDKMTLRWEKIEEYLISHDFIMNANVRELCGVSASTANRILSKLVANEKLIKFHLTGHWIYCKGRCFSTQIEEIETEYRKEI